MARAKKAAPDAAAKTEVTAATAAPETKAKAETKGVSDAAVTEGNAATIAKQSSTAAENQKAAHIYVGVSLPGIPANTTITGKIPAKLDVPFVRELVIPIDALTEFIKKKSVTNSRQAFCYRKSAEYAKELSK